MLCHVLFTIAVVRLTALYYAQGEKFSGRGSGTPLGSESGPESLRLSNPSTSPPALSGARVRPTLYGEYIYVDMHGTETVLNSTETWDPHPTDAGHKYMAQQILKALPRR